jgi:hypothetical protein
LVCLSLATTAHANGIADGTAGIAALNNGAYDEAIRLFTRAIKLGHLPPTDREAAYLDRGLAYMSEGQYRSAVADLRAALKLKPDDADAQSNLQVALSAQTKTAAPTGPAHKQSAQQQLLAAWGALGTLAGQYWLDSQKQPDFYVGYQWSNPGLTLVYSGIDRSGNSVVGQYQLDSPTGKITGLNVYKGKTAQVDVEVAEDGFAESGEENGVPLRETFQKISSSAFSVTTQAFKNGSWQNAAASTLVAVSPDVITALGWTPNAGKPQTPSFLSGLFDSMKQGALAGVTDGVHDGVQAKTRSAIAPQAYPQGQPAPSQ